MPVLHGVNDCCSTLGNHRWLCIIQGALLGKSAALGAVSMGHLDKEEPKIQTLVEDKWPFTKCHDFKFPRIDDFCF